MTRCIILVLWTSLLLFIGSFSTSLQAQDCVGNFELNNQSELNAFAAMGCVNVIGNLKVADDHLVDLSALSTVKHITGYLWIAVTSANDLTGFHSLERVDSFFRIYYNDKLLTLNGLQRLKYVGDRLAISGNNSLTSIDYLDNLDSIGFLELRDNIHLDTMGEFPSLLYAGTEIEISQCPLKNGISGFNNLESVETIRIENNAASRIEGFENLDTITRLLVSNNSKLTEVNGFSHLLSAQNILSFSHNPLLSSIEAFPILSEAAWIDFTNVAIHSLPLFPSLKKLGSLDIRNCPDLDTIRPFASLDSIGGLTISGNIKLKEVNGFTFAKVTSNFDFYSNPLLARIQFDGEIDSVNSLFVFNNPLLSDISSFDHVRKVDDFEMNKLPSLNLIPSFPVLETIKSSLRLIEVNTGHLNHFPVLQSVGRYNFSGDVMILDSIQVDFPITGFPNLEFTRDLTITRTPFTDLRFFTKLNTLSGDLLIDKNINLSSLFPNATVRKVERKITINNNPLLEDVTSLDSLLIPAVDKLTITGNTTLSSCNAYWICNAIDQGIPSVFSKNHSGCVSEYDVRKNCNLTYAHIVASAFYDRNQNGTQDPDEPLFSNAAIHIDPLQRMLLTDEKPVTYFIPFGDYKVTSTYQNMVGWALTSPDTLNVSLTSLDDRDTVRFGYYPSVVTERPVSHISSDHALCNHTRLLTVTLSNRGTALFSGKFWVQFTDEAPAVEYYTTPDFTEANKAGYAVTDLFPGQKLTFKFRYQVPGPPDFAIGNNISFSAVIEDENGNVKDSNSLATIVLCAFDPNDKSVNPSRAGNVTLPDEELVYTIRFQNTGNYPATDISVLDTLDPHLDLSTLQIISSSHPDVLITTVEDNIITFGFPGIYLPDSVNYEPLSHGFVTFSINPVNGVPLGTNVRNGASIYFDANPPVATNHTENVFKLVATDDVSKDDGSIFIYPNPVSDFNHIRIVASESGKGRTNIYSIEGMMLHERSFVYETGTNDIEFILPHTLTPGIYFANIVTDHKKVMQKLVVR